MNIFVAKLSYDTEERDLRNIFEQYGEVDSVKIVMDRDTGRSKGFGFVEMPNDDDGYTAINDLNSSVVDGKTIVVKKAESREPSRNRDNGGGGFNRGGGGYNRGGGYNNRY
jgi:RNA recognition motif-containing protein